MGERLGSDDKRSAHIADSRRMRAGRAAQVVARRSSNSVRPGQRTALWVAAAPPRPRGRQDQVELADHALATISRQADQLLGSRWAALDH